MSSMSKPILTQEKLRELFTNKDDVLYWNKAKSNRVAGKKAGYTSDSGYRVISVDNFKYREHTLIWIWYYGYMPKQQIDHIDHDKLNNSIDNLRLVSAKENNKNRPKQSNNSSGCVGVSWHKRASKWQAYVKNDGLVIFLGYFISKDEAKHASLSARRQLGFHENHGL